MITEQLKAKILLSKKMRFEKLMTNPPKLTGVVQCHESEIYKAMDEYAASHSTAFGDYILKEYHPIAVFREGNWIPGWEDTEGNDMTTKEIYQLFIEPHPLIP